MAPLGARLCPRGQDGACGEQQCPLTRSDLLPPLQAAQLVVDLAHHGARRAADRTIAGHRELPISVALVISRKSAQPPPSLHGRTSPRDTGLLERRYRGG